jgi:DNA (cytosine-5)-methyltransferase 1
MIKSSSSRHTTTDPMPNDTLTCSELFCGAGGLSEGFHQAGFSILAANDFDAHAVETMRATHPTTRVIHGPIQDISAKDLLKNSGLKKGELDVLSGGPPCQAFSVYNHQRGMHDERSGLFREYLRVVEELNPKFIVMENVMGILSIEEGLAVKEIQTRLKKLGYDVEYRVLKAEEYGVPQERRRVFFVANRIGAKFAWPSPTHGDQKVNPKLKPCVTVWDAIGDLPSLKITEGSECCDYADAPKTDFQRSMRQGVEKLYNHVAAYLSPINIERLEHIKPGGSWRDIPVRLLPAGMKKARRCDHTKRYGRLEKKGLASTILTKCDPHWGAYFHPTQDRTLTVREAARIQSFPDSFQFAGPRAEQYRQVGNAVPPLLARVVAASVADAIRAHRVGGSVVPKRRPAATVVPRDLANVG